MAGFLIAAGLLVATRGGKSTTCQPIHLSASDVRTRLDQGPFFDTGGGSCAFWFALDDGDIVAYKAIQPDGCVLHRKRDHWECPVGTTRDPAGLAQYPVTIQSIQGVDAVVVELRPTTPTS